MNQQHEPFHTKNFTMAEMTASETARKKGIDNTPDCAQIIALANLMANVLQPARDKLGMPITVTSGFRSKALNEATDGEPTSQHYKGQAADLQVIDNGVYSDSLTQLLFQYLKQMDVDQLLFEHKGKTRWIHVSYVGKVRNRRYINDNYKA